MGLACSGAGARVCLRCRSMHPSCLPQRLRLQWRPESQPLAGCSQCRHPTLCATRLRPIPLPYRQLFCRWCRRCRLWRGR